VVTSHVGRLYTLALALLVFFLTWSMIAARPWATSSTATTRPDPRIAALAARERRLRQETLVVQRVVQHRWAVYRVALRSREAAIASAKQAQLAAASAPAVSSSSSASAPAVQVVNLPPLTVTRTS
jgi:hypothetical protein